MARKKVKLVHDWKNCWKWFSMRISIVGIIGMSGLTTYNMMNTKLQDAMPAWAVAAIAVVIFFCICFGRVIDQKKGDK